MSYAIQNFYNVNQALIVNQKLYLNWTFRNLIPIVTLITKNVLNNYGMVIYNNYGKVLLALFNIFFCDGFYKIFRNLIGKWKPLLGTNYTKSLEYWTFKAGSAFCDNEPLSIMPTPITDQWFFNQYHSSVVLSNISLHNKYYRTVLIKFMLLLLNNWQLWKKTHNISWKFLIINKNFHIIRYYNYYYFKMYNF